jgi:3-hydroxyisobutyryl-CoA hydrolase
VSSINRYKHTDTYHIVSELGFATHYIPSRRIPVLLERLAALEGAHVSVIDHTIEEFSSERQPDEPPMPFSGAKRNALDFAFQHNKVERIFEELEALTHNEDPSISKWATDTLTTLKLRSPTSLKVALKAIRKGKTMTLLEALDMELKIATAYCVSKHCVLIIMAYPNPPGAARTVPAPILPLASTPY